MISSLFFWTDSEEGQNVWAIRPPSSDLGSATLNNEDMFHGQFLALSFRNCYWWHQLLWVMVLNDRESQWLQLLVTIALYVATCHDSDCGNSQLLLSTVLERPSGSLQSLLLPGRVPWQVDSTTSAPLFSAEHSSVLLSSSEDFFKIDPQSNIGEVKL